MKQFTFLVTEFGPTTKTERVFIVKAKTRKSAESKVWNICGNRSWQVEDFQAGVMWDDNSISDMRGITYTVKKVGF